MKEQTPFQTALKEEVLKNLSSGGRSNGTVKKDSAMLGQMPQAAKSSQDLGGIDLNQINVNRTGNTIKVNFGPAQLNELLQGGFEGFSPVIINITPISSPLPLLGVSPRKEQEGLAKV